MILETHTAGIVGNYFIKKEANIKKRYTHPELNVTSELMALLICVQTYTQHTAFEKIWNSSNAAADIWGRKMFSSLEMH